eukprot:UN01397
MGKKSIFQIKSIITQLKPRLRILQEKALEPKNERAIYAVCVPLMYMKIKNRKKKIGNFSHKYNNKYIKNYST